MAATERWRFNSRMTLLMLGLLCGGLMLLWAAKGERDRVVTDGSRDGAHEGEHRPALEMRAEDGKGKIPGGSDGVFVGDVRLQLGSGCDVAVVEANSQRPIPGAVVFVTVRPFGEQMSGQLEVYTNESTDKTGHARFKTLPTGKTVHFEVKAPDYLSARFSRAADAIRGTTS